MTSYDRGHKIYLKKGFWYYVDNDEILSNDRPCKRCGKPPTKEGYDACIGHLENASSICCGHGVSEPINMQDLTNE